MLEALSFKNNAETRYRCQVSVYRTIGPLVFVLVAIILVYNQAQEILLLALVFTLLQIHIIETCIKAN